MATKLSSALWKCYGEKVYSTYTLYRGNLMVSILDLTINRTHFLTHKKNLLGLCLCLGNLFGAIFSGFLRVIYKSKSFSYFSITLVRL